MPLLVDATFDTLTVDATVVDDMPIALCVATTYRSLPGSFVVPQAHAQMGNGALTEKVLGTHALVSKRTESCSSLLDV